MPLRDHFRPPLYELRHWEGVHGQWPAMIVLHLANKLPKPYFAEPRVHPGGNAEIDVATFREDQTSAWAGDTAHGAESAAATAVWAPPRPTLSLVSDLPAVDEYEVRVFDEQRGCRLVAAVEIVSPANKDRPEHRRAFAAKCLALLQQQVSVVIVDVVTFRRANLYGEALEMLGQSDPALGADPPHLYAVSCRGTRRDGWRLESWLYPLSIGQSLPAVPLWLADDLAIPLELEASYEDACRALRIS